MTLPPEPDPILDALCASTEADDILDRIIAETAASVADLDKVLNVEAGLAEILNRATDTKEKRGDRP